MIGRYSVRRAGLLLLALTLASCAPRSALGPPAAASANALDPDRATLSATWADVSVLTFSAGLSDAFDLKVTVTGSDLRVNAPEFCRTDRQATLCTVPRLPAGRNFVLPMRGSNLNAVAAYKRASGQSYSSAVKQ